jgi:hypothetical protein
MAEPLNKISHIPMDGFHPWGYDPMDFEVSSPERRMDDVGNNEVDRDQVDRAAPAGGDYLLNPAQSAIQERGEANGVGGDDDDTSLWRTGTIAQGAVEEEGMSSEEDDPIPRPPRVTTQKEDDVNEEWKSLTRTTLSHNSKTRHNLPTREQASHSHQFPSGLSQLYWDCEDASAQGNNLKTGRRHEWLEV